MTERTQFTAYITKYALTKGIFALLVEDNFNISPNMVSEVGNGWRVSYHGEGKDWHRTRAGAEARANDMRAAKIKSLQKQLVKLEKLRFGSASP